MRRSWLPGLKALLVAASVASIGYAACDRSGDVDRSTFGSLPRFSFVDQRGEPFTRESLRGHVWVVDFVFTKCPTICPLLTARMANLQTRLALKERGVRLLSLSVDPETDTPERLAEYAKKFRANPAVWTFATGPISQVATVVRKGFKQAVGERVPRGEGTYDILHSTRFVLLDRNGTIRGFYPSDTEGQTRLIRDARALVRAD